METKTTPVHPLLVGTTPGEYIIDGSSIFVLNEDGTNRISAQVQRGWENQWKDGGSRTTNEEVEAVARLFRAAPSLAAENALLVEQNARLREALDKDVARFDGILGDMPRLARMTPTERMSYDAKIAAYRNEARELLTSLTHASK